MKKILKTGIVIILVVAFAFLYAYHIDKIVFLYDQNQDSIEFVQTGVLVDDEVSQTFVSTEDVLDGMSVRCFVVGDVSDVTIEYSLKDTTTREVLATGTSPAHGISNDRFHIFRFNQVSDTKGNQYTFTLRVTGSMEGNGVGFQMANGILDARTVSRQFEPETFIIVLLFAIYIAVFMRLLYKLFK